MDATTVPRAGRRWLRRRGLIATLVASLSLLTLPLLGGRHLRPSTSTIVDSVEGVSVVGAGRPVRVVRDGSPLACYMIVTADCPSIELFYGLPEKADAAFDGADLRDDWYAALERDGWTVHQLRDRTRPWLDTAGQEDSYDEDADEAGRWYTRDGVALVVLLKGGSYQRLFNDGAEVLVIGKQEGDRRGQLPGPT